MSRHCTWEGFYVHDNGTLEHLVCVDPPTHEVRLAMEGVPGVERGEFLCCKHRTKIIDEILESEFSGVVITYDERYDTPTAGQEAVPFLVEVKLYEDTVYKLGDWWACRVVIQVKGRKPSTPSPPMQVLPATTDYYTALAAAQRRVAELTARMNRSH